MELSQLQSIGAFVPKTLFRKEVEFSQPVLKPEAEWVDAGVPEFTGELVDSNMTIWVRKRNSADFMQLRLAPDVDKWHLALVLSVCHEDGRPAFVDKLDEKGRLEISALDRAKQLRDWLFVPMMTAVNEVNGEGAKNSQPRTNGGASSRSASAGEQSRNGRRLSRKKSSTRGARTPPSAAP